jgi:hypothetical protein
MAPATPCPILHLVPAAAPAFTVPPALAGPWRRLAGAARDHVGAFLGEIARVEASDVRVIAPAGAPPTFAADLARGGSELHAAFPDLVRRVVAIDETADGRVTIKLTCEGTHDGAFFGFMLPTRRTVEFAEIHHLRIAGDRVVEDQLELDLRGIIRQLGAPSVR